MWGGGVNWHRSQRPTAREEGEGEKKVRRKKNWIASDSTEIEDEGEDDLFITFVVRRDTVCLLPGREWKD